MITRKPSEQAPGRAQPQTSAARRRFQRNSQDPPWQRPSLLALLAATALLYLWRLGDSGYANSFYSAAVQAGSTSWKAFFFGSFDSANFITVDKPPASLWVMELSVRIFGLSSWSILVPQALEGVAAVGLLYLTVRRVAGPAAGLVAGGVLAVTPVAVLMFRFNNPDALLTLLLVASAYALVRALERAGTRWLILCSVLVGTAFLTKMLQAFAVVPVFALVYLLTAPTQLRRRLVQLLAAGATLAVASGWWVAIVEVTPTSARPYIGGSQDNSLLNLIFGYNGFGRLTGNESGSVGGGPSGAWGATGWNRLFSSEMGGQISWLIPAALIAAGYLLWRRRARPRTDLLRATTLIFAGWLLLTGLLFSYARGIIHPYYTVALAPAIAGLVGLGTVVLWRRRTSVEARMVSAVALLTTVGWSYILLARTPSFYPALRYAILIVGVAAALLLISYSRLPQRLIAVVAIAASAATLAGPAAYALSTATTPYQGAIPAAGPASTGGSPGGGAPPQGVGQRGALAQGTRPPNFGGGQFAPPSAGSTRGQFGSPGQATGGAMPRQGGTGGGLLDASTPNTRLTRLLERDAARYRWVAATVGANSAAGYQLATNEPVMAIGGFNGTDPTPTLAQFQSYVRAGKIHYFIGSRGGGFAGGGSSNARKIASWVSANFHSRSIGGVTIYDLSQ